MAHEIIGNLYHVRGFAGEGAFVECDSFEELCIYVVDCWYAHGFPVKSVVRIEKDGRRPKVPILTSNLFKKLIKERRI